MAIVKRIYRAGTLDALLSRGQPATADDVSITKDGRRLDTAEAVIEFMEISTWRTAAGDIDVLHYLRDDLGERLRYDDLTVRSLVIEVVGIDVQLAGLRDIVASKRFAGRDKDREALPELERLLAQDPS